MKELMLELLTYEPFEKFLPEEKTYICEILSGNDNPPPSLAKFHKLFLDFYYCVQRGAFDDVDWLRQWKAAYGRARLPLLFKKICFYLMVKGTRSESDFMGQIGLQVSRIKKWGISAQFRKYAETDTYSTIKIFRNGVKKEYIVSTVKQLYYEAGRQVYDKAEADRQVSESKAQFEKEPTTLKDPPWFVQYSMKLNNLPQFVDVFAGSASVAASVVTEGCPPPIVNDKDPVMVCFAWAFVHCKSELRKRIADFHNYVINQELKDLSYDEDDYEGHNKNPTIHNSAKVLDEPRTRWLHEEVYHEDIATLKMLAQRYQEFIMRIRSSYIDVANVLALNDRDREELRRKFQFNELSPHSITQIEDVLDYALAIFYYYSFEPGGQTGNAYHECYISASSYFSYLNRLVNLDAISREVEDVKAHILAKLEFEASSLILESTGHFSRYLQDAKFYSEDFKELLKITHSDAVYYWDSPYYLTTGYDVDFSDKAHKDMLDILRDATFKWIFSMQYNLSYRYWCADKDKAKRKKQPCIIRDYGDYYRGFYAPFQLAADQRTYYVPADAPMEDAENLYVILFDFDKVKKKWPKMRTETTEMLVVNFNPLRTIPLHDSAVVYPFDLFLKCADETKDYQDIAKAYKDIVKDYKDIVKNYKDIVKNAYQDIVKKAVDWRKANVESKYTNEAPV